MMLHFFKCVISVAALFYLLGDVEMKKFSSLLLALFLFFALVACESNKETLSDIDESVSSQTGIENDDDLNTETNKFTEPKDYAMILQLSINPKFKIYLDKNLKVIYIKALNDDAISVLKDYNYIVDDTFETVIDTLISKGKESGYVKRNSPVNIELSYVNKESANISDMTDRMATLTKEMSQKYNAIVKFKSPSDILNNDTSSSNKPTSSSKLESSSNKPTFSSKPASSSGATSSNNSSQNTQNNSSDKTQSEIQIDYGSIYGTEWSIEKFNPANCEFDYIKVNINILEKPSIGGEASIYGHVGYSPLILYDKLTDEEKLEYAPFYKYEINGNIYVDKIPPGNAKADIISDVTEERNRFTCSCFHHFSITFERINQKQIKVVSISGDIEVLGFSGPILTVGDVLTLD